MFHYVYINRIEFWSSTLIITIILFRYFSSVSPNSCSTLSPSKPPPPSTLSFSFSFYLMPSSAIFSLRSDLSLLLRARAKNRREEERDEGNNREIRRREKECTDIERQGEAGWGALRSEREADASAYWSLKKPLCRNYA